MGSPFEDGAHELEQRHVGATPGTVDGEEAQARGGQTVEVGAGGHPAPAFLLTAERDRAIHPSVVLNGICLVRP